MEAIVQSLKKLPLHLLAGIGGAAGFMLLGFLYFVYGLAFEIFAMPSLRIPGAPILSYGQQSVFLAYVAGFIGAAAGVSVALAVYRQWTYSALITLVPCGLSASFVLWRWNDQFASYGSDPSEYILFWPFVVLIPATLFAGFLAVAISVVAWLKRSR